MPQYIKKSLVCYVIVNVHASAYNKTNDKTGVFCWKLERVFDQFPTITCKILLGDIRDDIFKPAVRNEGLHDIMIMEFFF
jgi:hypothetical protein